MEAEPDECPLCGEAGPRMELPDVPAARVCENDLCPIGTWNADVGWQDTECEQCGEHFSRPLPDVDRGTDYEELCMKCGFELTGEKMRERGEI